MLGGGYEGLKDEENLGERKVYSRRSFKELDNSKSSSNLLSEQHMATEGLDSTKRLHNSGLDVGLGLGVKGGFLGQENKVRISLSMESKREALELRRKLEGERDMVRNVMRKIEATEGLKNSAQRFDTRDGDNVNQLSVLVDESSKGVSNNLEKEKRTPKANKLYRNSEFLLAKDKIPQADGNKKPKSNVKKGGGNGQGMKKFSNPVLKSCHALLERLMKHKHGWVFKKPVDAVGLGLHDYFEIIRNPMDLGTVKDRLTQNWYKSPVEFAEDVRLTFRNAMTYNPKGQDVHVMAELLLKIFEDKWPLIEADYIRELKLAADVDVGLAMPKSRNAPPQSLAFPDMEKNTDRPESIAYAVNAEREKKNIAQSSKLPVQKKPKAKDPDKRDMTYDEKQKLSINLQSLPSEKLENVVQIIKKRNPSVSQQEDEIEVDIDSVDTETLWELDRFITNYKKSLSKNKRKTEIVCQSVTGLDQNTKEKVTTSVVTESPKGSRLDEVKVISPAVEVEETRVNDTNQGASQSSSSSDSGSSSSGDSDGESSSAEGSDGGS